MKLVLTALLCFALTAHAAEGRYLIVADAQGGVWKIDTTTGELWKCLQPSGPVCLKVERAR